MRAGIQLTDLARMGGLDHAPDPCGFVTRTGDNQMAIPRKVEGVNFLLMAVEDCANALLGDVPNLPTVFRSLI